jgi:hypothetical protein
MGDVISPGELDCAEEGCKCFCATLEKPSFEGGLVTLVS